MDRETLDTYNEGAVELAHYFRGIGSRVKDIEKALELADVRKNSADVIELGCGDGRDAAEIIKRTKSYLGIDYSEELIRLAKGYAPSADFITDNMTTFNYPTNAYDIVFAFASLLHLNKENIRKLMPRVARSLKQNGIFYISLKYYEEYKKEWKEDQFGKRLFYFYNQKIIKDLGKEFFYAAYTDQQTIGHTKWFTIALKKK